MTDAKLSGSVPMSDYDAIRNLIGSYGQSVDVRPRDPDLIASHYIEDRTFTDNGVTISTRAKLRALMEAARTAEIDAPKLSGSKHVQVNTVINVDGDRADGTTQLIVLELNAEQGWRIRGCGFYTDDVVRDHDGRWRFKSRTVNWIPDAGPDPLNPALGEMYKDFFKAIMAAP